MSAINRTRTVLAAVLSIAVLLVFSAPLHAGTIIKSPLDKRQYDFFILPNKLRVLLVSDPTADKAAACMDVNVGYFDDPHTHPGMAHFLEHMLFLGTRKFPAASAYHEFISAHGGRDNAATGAEHTNFYFDIDPHSLDPALDRFSQFFMAPLFDSKFMQRELNAANAEYRLKLKDDGRRYWSVMKATMNPDHPFSKFSVGNLGTLANMRHKQLRSTLIKFYRQHYSANLMTLTLIGRAPLSILKQMVEKYFSAIKNRQLQKSPLRAPLFLSNQLGVRINVIPLRDIRQLHLSFPLPWKPSFYQTKPELLIAFLLGDEGRGSLLSLLKQRGWANRLSVDTTTNAGNYHTMEVMVDLTREGQRNINTITDMVFQYLHLLDRPGRQMAIYDEIRKINAINFRYREPPPAYREARILASNLQIYPPEEVLHGPYLFKAYDQQSLRKLLEKLSPDNLRLTVFAKKLPTNRQDHWYNTPYKINPLSEILRTRWQHSTANPALRIPAKNPFIPTRLGIKPHDKASAHPSLLIDDQALRLWHKQDDTFLIPKADIVIRIMTPLAGDNPAHTMLTSLYLRLVNDHLNEYTYPARLAGLHYALDYTNDGIAISVSGYEDKQGLLLDVILQNLLEPDIDAQRFAINKEKLRQNLANSHLGKPYRQLSRELNTILLHNSWEPDEYLQALTSLTRKDLKSFIHQLYSQVNVEILAHGNITPQEARKLGRRIGKRIFRSATPGPDKPLRVTRLTPGTQFLRAIKTDHEDAGLLVYYQAWDDTLQQNARIILLQQLIKGPFFYFLRTREQLGYVVFAGNNTVLRVPGLKFIIESPKKSPAELLSRIDTFLKKYPSLLQVMGEGEYLQSKEGLLSRILERDTSLQKRSGRYRKLLALKYYDFLYRRKLAKIIRRISKQDMLDFYRLWILSSRRQRLIIQSPGTHQRQLINDSTFTPIRDIHAFKKSMPSIELSAH